MGMTMTQSAPIANLVPCESCDQSGFSDKVYRGIFIIEPLEKLCRVCGGRGWRLPVVPLNGEKVRTG